MAERTCCCPRFVTARECLAIRYNLDPFGRRSDEMCECRCHDVDEDACPNCGFIHCQCVTTRDGMRSTAVASPQSTTQE